MIDSDNNLLRTKLRNGVSKIANLFTDRLSLQNPLVFNLSKIFLLFLMPVYLSTAGCSSRSKSGATSSSAGVKQTNEEDSNFVKSALEYTTSIERYEEKGFKESMVEDLNSWARTRSEANQWQPDPMLEQLPENLRTIESVRSIGDMSFHRSDADYLQECIWAKTIAERVTGGPAKGVFQYLVGAACQQLDKAKIIEVRSSQDPLFSALQILHPELAGEQLENLNRSLLVFDWIVRNIQLDEMPVEFTGPAEINKAKEFVDVPTGDAATDGVEGPGYSKSPSQILLTGKSDVWQRSRLFILLCRQLGIDAFMLNVIDRNDETKQIPWAVGVLLSDQIYLFDMQMGLPLPSKDYRKIATYREVLEDRSILTQLRYKLSESIDADPDYRIPPGQLDRVAVWLSGSEESMSHRMSELQSRLTGDFNARISFEPSELASRLERWNFHKIELCPHPFQQILYERAFEKAIERRKEAALIKNYLENEYFRIRIPIKKVIRTEKIDDQSQSIRAGGKLETPTVIIYLLTEARHRFLLGVFEPDMKKEKNSLGARKLREDLDLGRKTEDAAQMFVNLTLDDNRIEEILGDDDWLTMLGLAAESNTTMSDQELAQYKSIIESSMRLIRADSSIWLALTNFETGDFGNSQNWLNQIARFDTNKKWVSLTEYNLARTNEALLDFKKSIEVLRKTKSPQRFGNIIRARLIQRWNLGDESATQPE